MTCSWVWRYDKEERIEKNINIGCRLVYMYVSLEVCFKVCEYVLYSVYEFGNGNEGNEVSVSCGQRRIILLEMSESDIEKLRM